MLKIAYKDRVEEQNLSKHDNKETSRQEQASNFAVLRLG